MEIHAPQGPITSWREVLLHLGIVTIGILIALGLETLVELKQHHDMGAEARENITHELQDNKRELDAFLSQVPETLTQQKIVLHAIDDLIRKHKLEVHELTLHFSNPELRDASWSTAQAAGDLRFLPYADIKKYAGVYEVQDQYHRLGEKTLDSVISALDAFEFGGDPESLPEDELRTEREKVLTALSSLTAQSQVGEQLSKRYAEVLHQ